MPLVHTYARKNPDGTVMHLCRCDCHFGWEDNRKPRNRPEAVFADLCEPCMDEAYQPWTATLSSLPR